MNFTRQQIADACRTAALGKSMALPVNVELVQLLWAICGNESSFGVNCNPRHEPAYDEGGTYAKTEAQAALLEKFGSHGACSYGPMQVMLVNAPAGYTPAMFDDVDLAVEAGVYALGNPVLHNAPKTLSEIGACYNGGHVGALKSPAVQEYARKLIMNYQVQIV